MFCKNVVLKIFRRFQENHLRQSAFWKLITTLNTSFLLFFYEFPKNIQNSYIKRKPSDKFLFINLICFIKGHLWMSGSDEKTLKKKFGGSEPSSTLALKTKWYHSCCCDDSRSCGQLKKCVLEKYFEKSWTLKPNHFLLWIYI